METEMAPINGFENTIDLQSDELKSVLRFYKAFNGRSLELMQEVWLTTDDISMDNPIGGIRRGWSEIKAGYDRIFNGKAKVYVEFYDYTLHTTPDMFFVTGRERGHFKTDSMSFDLAIRTSRIFVKSNGEWKHIHHHGSIDNPELLKTYQEAVIPK
jgi:ketosteroid isomerase-like protein